MRGLFRTTNPEVGVGELQPGERLQHVAAGLIFVDHEGDDVVEADSRDHEIEAAQPQRRRAHDSAEHRADDHDGRHHEHERQTEVGEPVAGERANSHEGRMPERNLPGIAGEDSERHRSDNRDEELAADVDPVSAADQREGDGRRRQRGQIEHAPRRIEQRHVVGVADLEIPGPMGRHGQIRSIASLVPNSPHGRTSSTSTSAKNGTASDACGLT